jgi:hypothetical protein
MSAVHFKWEALRKHSQPFQLRRHSKFHQQGLEQMKKARGAAVEQNSGLPVLAFADVAALEMWFGSQPGDTPGLSIKFARKGALIAHNGSAHLRPGKQSARSLRQSVLKSSASGSCSPPFLGWPSLSWFLLLAELLLGAVNQPFKRTIRDQTEPG